MRGGIKMDNIQNSASAEQFEESVDEVTNVGTEEVANVEKVEEIEEVEQTEESSSEVDSSIDSEGIEIDGEKYTLEELREFKQAGLRQSDYTRKTQQLSQREKELQEASEFYNYFAQNPHLLEQLAQADVDPSVQQKAMHMDPAMQRVQQLEAQMYEERLSNELQRLSNKYDDFNDVAVLEKATQMGVTDLEFVYRGMREEKEVDVESIRQEAIKEAKEELAKEIQANKGKTKTLVNTSDTVPTPQVVELSAKEKEIADGLGVSYEDYAKNK